jgi:hypothetical protein
VENSTTGNLPHAEDTSPPSDTQEWAAAHLPGLNQIPAATQSATVPGDPGTVTIPSDRAECRPDPAAGRRSDALWRAERAHLAGLRGGERRTANARA